MKTALFMNVQPHVLIYILAALLFSATEVSAQEPVPATDPASSSSIVAKARDAAGTAFDGPVRPVFKGVGSGGGIGFGVRADLPSPGPWETSTTAIVTLRRYWSVQLDTEYQGERTAMAAYARIRDMSRLNFFGLGANSLLDDRTTFRLRDPIVGVIATLRVAPLTTVGARVEEMWPSVAGGRSSEFPSIEQRFGDSAVPALLTQARLGRYQTFVEIDIPAAVGEALHQGAKYRLAYAIVDDHDLDRFSFRRLDLEAQQRFAGLAPLHRLTLHGWLSTTRTSDQHDVPFFLQPTLGGKSYVRSVHEDLIGSDGTRATLRGFRSLRFRDRNLLLLQAEYRLPVWGPLDATMFVDAGTVASRPAGLRVSDLKRSYGFSLSLMRKSEAAARVDVGFGGGEGTRVLVSLGNFVP